MTTQWNIYSVGNTNPSQTTKSNFVEVVNRCYVFYDDVITEPVLIWPAEGYFVRRVS